MMTAEDNLLRTFDTVYKAAVAARNAGRYNKAKRDFYRAAELMTELAKMSGDKLKAARVDRAKRIIAIADGLPQSDLLLTAILPKLSKSILYFSLETV